MFYNVAVVGLGKLGSCLAAVLADSGFVVTGIDTDAERVRIINEGKAPVYEPNLDDLVSTNVKQGRLTATATLNCESLRKVSITFIVVPTPSLPSGKFSLEYVLDVAKDVSKIIKETSDYHTVVITSTISPHSMERIQEAIEEWSSKKCGVGFGLCYNPEFIALGNVIEGLRNPDFVLVGYSDQAALERLEYVYEKVFSSLPRIPPLYATSFVNAEIAKIAINSYVTTKISFVNALAQICEAKGGDIDEVSKIVGADKRIGHKYFKGGLGYGGPCFTRDNRAFIVEAGGAAWGAISKASDTINEAIPTNVFALIEWEVTKAPTYKKSPNLGFLGVTYKPNTNVTEESQAVRIIDKCVWPHITGGIITFFDPAVEKITLNRGSLFALPSAEEVVEVSDIVVVTTPWEEFKNIPLEAFRGKTVIDCWRHLPETKEYARKYISLGVG